MKLSYLQGKAATIAGLEVDRAMSVFQISGSIAGIQEIKVGPIMGKTKKICPVKVIFSKDLKFWTEIVFNGTPVLDFIHWNVASVVTYYHGYLPYKSERIPLY